MLVCPGSFWIKLGFPPVAQTGHCSIPAMLYSIQPNISCEADCMNATASYFSPVQTSIAARWIILWDCLIGIDSPAPLFWRKQLGEPSASHSARLKTIYKSLFLCISVYFCVHLCNSVYIFPPLGPGQPSALSDHFPPLAMLTIRRGCAVRLFTFGRLEFLFFHENPGYFLGISELENCLDNPPGSVAVSIRIDRVGHFLVSLRIIKQFLGRLHD